LCQQADEICISITELAIDFVAQDGRAENLRATLIVAMATSPAFARKGLASSFQSAAKDRVAKADRDDVPRNPDDVALDRNIGSICRC
jgi:hypothetical protein